MTNGPNPEKLLRRPKKEQQPTSSNGGKFFGAAAGGVVVIGAAVAFVVMHHSPSAGSSMAQPESNAAPVSNTATLAALQPSAASFASRAAKLTVKSAPAPKPSSAASPSPQPSPSPSSAATLSSTHVKTAAEIAKAKHEAALRLAELRRAQAQATHAAFPVATTVSANAPAAQPPSAAPTQTSAAPTPNAAPTPVYAPSVVVDARFVDRVAPVYPDIAKEQGVQGTAIVLATVGPQGSVLSVEIDQSTGNKLLDAAALSAARSSRFEPPEIDGKPATETYRIVYTFDANQ